MGYEAPPFSLGYWWTTGLEIEAGWIKDPIALEFLGDRFWLRPARDTALPDISIAASDSKNGNEYFRKTRRLLSLLCWFEDRRISESTNVGSGGPVPIRVGNIQASPIKSFFGLDMELRFETLPSVPNDDAWLGLALYREALGLNSVAYQVLGFLKIINIRYATGPLQKQYIAGALLFLNNPAALKRLAILQAQEPDVAAYLYESCRCAVAHASTQPLVDPDNADDTGRLHADIPLIRDLARHCIEYELGVKSARTVRGEHLYATDGFERVLPMGFAGAVASGISVPLASLRLPKMDVRVRGKAQGIALSEMIARIESLDAVSGILRIRLQSTKPLNAVELRIAANLKKKLLIFEPATDMHYLDPRNAEDAQAVIDFIELQRAMIGNGVFEVYESGTSNRLGRMEPYISSNVDLFGTVNNMEAGIAELRARFNMPQSPPGH